MGPPGPEVSAADRALAVEKDSGERCAGFMVTGTGPGQAHVAPLPLLARQSPARHQGREPSGLSLPFTITSSHSDLRNYSKGGFDVKSSNLLNVSI